jgi:polar amino acid transport system substrate-binding protein
MHGSLKMSSAVLAATIAVIGGIGPASAADFKTVQPDQLTIAYRTDDKPVSFIVDGKPTGFLIDFENAVADELHLKAVFIATDFASMLPGVRNQRYDSAAFDVLVTPEREKVVDFTKAVGYRQARLVARKNAPISDVADTKGKVVAITRGSALIPKLKELVPGVSIREFPNIASSLNALLANQVDGLFTGLTTADDLVAKHQELMASQLVTTGKAAFPIAQENPGLKAAYNKAITDLMTDGTYAKLFAKWNPPGTVIPDELYKDYPGMPHEKIGTN